jgi:hypothetical protein
MSVLATSVLITSVVILEFVSGNVARLIIIGFGSWNFRASDLFVGQNTYSGSASR